MRPNYTVLANWTDQGVRTARETVDRYEAARGQFEGLGVRLRETYWTVGPYDTVLVAEAADDETLSTALLALSWQGNLRTTSMRAFSPDEMRGIVQRVP